MSYRQLPRITKKTEEKYTRELNDLLMHFQENDVEIHNFMATINGKVSYSFYNEPYTEDRPHILHSLTKLFTNTAVAQANMAGLVNLDDKVISFFEDEKEKYLPEDISEYLAMMTVKDLITMRSGHDREISGSEWRPLKTSWIQAFFKEPIVHQPGEYYCYSSACSYMLSAIVQRVTGKTAHQYLVDGVLNKLEIDPFDWDISPEGINSGGNGISMRVEDVLKLAMLYQQNGIWDGKQLISKDWIDNAFGIINKKEIAEDQTPYNFHLFEYGDVYTASGIFGQNAMIIPKLDMVIVVFAATVDWEDVPRITNEYFVQPILNRKNISKKVIDTGLSQLFNSSSLLNSNKSVKSNNEFSTRTIDYYMADNEDQIEKLGFQQLDDETLILYFTDHRGNHVVHSGLNRWSSSISSITGNYLHHQYQLEHAHLVTKSWWITSHTLVMELRFIGTAFCDTLTFDFSDNYDNLSFNRWVNVNTQATERETIQGKKVK